MSRTILLDAGPLGLLVQRSGIDAADQCRSWARERLLQGDQLFVPEIADYEVRRELLRLDLSNAIERLDGFNHATSGRYLPLTTPTMRRAAQLWAEVRRRGFPTADRHALDADVIIAAQAMTLTDTGAEVIVTSTNTIHLERLVRSAQWNQI